MKSPIKDSFPICFPFLALFIIGVIVWSGFGLRWLKEGLNQPEIVLPILVLTGATILLFSLTFIATAFATLNLTDRAHALALPEGSVRALIAMLLITIFAISGIFLFRQIRFPPTYTVTGLSLKEKNELIKKIPPKDILSITSKQDEKSNIVKYKVIRLIEENKKSEDFAAQILTTIGTLVVAVAGFYFGTRSVTAAKKALEISNPIIHGIDPPKGKRGQEFSVEIDGDNFQMPEVVKLIHGRKNEIICESILSSTNKIKGKIKIGKQDPEDDKWTLVVVNKDGGECRRDNAFEVEK